MFSGGSICAVPMFSNTMQDACHGLARAELRIPAEAEDFYDSAG